MLLFYHLAYGFLCWKKNIEVYVENGHVDTWGVG